MFKIFKKQPTVSQVDEQLSKLDTDRAALQQRQTMIIDELAADDANADALTTEHAGIALRLNALDRRANLLRQERQQAVLREIASTFETRAKGISDSVEQLREISPQLEETRRALLVLESTAQRLRERVNVGQIALSDGLLEQGEQNGISRADLSAALQAVKDRYPLLFAWVATTSAEARQYQAMQPQRQEQS